MKERSAEPGNQPSLIPLLLAALQSGAFADEFQTLESEKQRQLIEFLESFISSTTFRATRSWSPEYRPGHFRDFLLAHRRDGLLDLSSIDHRQFPPDTWRSNIDRLQEQIDQWGEQSIAHLCLPTLIHNALIRNDIFTIDQLEQRLTGLWTLPQINLKQEEEIRQALSEIHQLRN